MFTVFNDIVSRKELTDEYILKKGLILTNYKNTKNNEDYQIIRYDKSYMTFDMIPKTGLLRSVILKNVKLYVIHHLNLNYYLNLQKIIYMDQNILD